MQNVQARKYETTAADRPASVHMRCIVQIRLSLPMADGNCPSGVLSIRVYVCW